MTCHTHGAHNAHLVNATAWRRSVRPVPTPPRWAVIAGVLVVMIGWIGVIFGAIGVLFSVLDRNWPAAVWALAASLWAAVSIIKGD